jgi:hypothetical protein
LPVYDVAAVAHATELDLKQLDNLISRNALTGIHKKRQGIPRRLSPDIAVVIRLAKMLSAPLNVPVGRLLPVAHAVLNSASDEVPLAEFVRLRVDLKALRADTLARLDSAVELVGRRPRGRPPVKRGRLPDEG